MAIKVGDRVRVKPDVGEPLYGWGEIEADSVGVVKKILNDCVGIDFPEQKGWVAKIEELELVNPPAPAKPIYTAKDIRNRPVYKQLKASAADAKTLTKLVKLYLKTFNESTFGNNRDFEGRTRGIINSFGWLEGDNEVIWIGVHEGRRLNFDQIPNPPKAAKAKPVVKVEAPKPPVVENKPAPKRIGWWA